MQYLDQLRGFRTTIDRIETAVGPLTDPEPGTDDEERLTKALGLLDGDLDWSCMTASVVTEKRTQLETLDRIVGDANPEDVTGIGLLHDDADALRAQINTLDRSDGMPDLIEVDNGVIIQ
jgi:hypothetical protein